MSSLKYGRYGGLLQEKVLSTSSTADFSKPKIYAVPAVQGPARAFYGRYGRFNPLLKYFPLRVEEST
jgi:hypothetical protein